MLVAGESHRSIVANADGGTVTIVDQTLLPHRFETRPLETLDHAIDAIRHMWVRGAPLIGVTAAYGMALAMRSDSSDEALDVAARRLPAARPTAINLAWAVDRMHRMLIAQPPASRAIAAFAMAAEIAEEDVNRNARLGDNGLALIREIAATKAAGEPVNILTHCNAGWLAAVDWGTATAPIYKASEAGIPIHVWVDETRPRNQGAFLTAWELGGHGVPHTVVVDNAGGHLMREGMVDLVIVGTDRVTAKGDVCNKIGTYLKALAAHDNGIPFYVAAPSSSIDFTIEEGHEIPIENRGEEEVTHMSGVTSDGRLETIRVVPEGSPTLNPGFDVTPARLVTGLITERGIVPATHEALCKMFSDHVAFHRAG
jgi:methylthioribose-1-phosphate isomerase